MIYNNNMSSWRPDAFISARPNNDAKCQYDHFGLRGETDKINLKLVT